MVRWHAWHAGVANRADKWPSFEEFMGVEVEAMDDDELDAAMERWMAHNNARLGPEDRNVIVAELIEE